jgi:hypothetical protein
VPFNLLLLPLIGGFVLLSHWNLTVFFAKRLEKERLLLYSSLVGAILLALSFGLVIFIVSYPTWWIFKYPLKLRTWWAYHTPPFEYSGITVLALLIGTVSPYILNRFWPFCLLWTKEKRGAKATEGYGSPLEQLLLKALKEEKYVMVTLGNGKVYIGRVTISLAPEDDRSFELLPIKSGYREGDKHRLELTTHYDDAYQQMFAGEANPIDAVSDFGVVIPVKEVVSATLFRPDLYAKYFPHESAVAPSPAPPLVPLSLPSAEENAIDVTD